MTETYIGFGTLGTVEVHHGINVNVSKKVKLSVDSRLTSINISRSPFALESKVLLS